jgi:hypothetical protein
MTGFGINYYQGGAAKCCLDRPSYALPFKTFLFSHFDYQVTTHTYIMAEWVPESQLLAGAWRRLLSNFIAACPECRLAGFMFKGRFAVVVKGFHISVGGTFGFRHPRSARQPTSNPHARQFGATACQWDLKNTAPPMSGSLVSRRLGVGQSKG